jgi:hypothetical protein
VQVARARDSEVCILTNNSPIQVAHIIPARIPQDTHWSPFINALEAVSDNLNDPEVPPLSAAQFETPDALGNLMCLDHGIHAMFDAEAAHWAVFIPSHPFGPQVDRLEVHTVPPRPPVTLKQEDPFLFHGLPQHLPTLLEPAANAVTQFRKVQVGT